MTFVDRRRHDKVFGNLFEFLEKKGRWDFLNEVAEDVGVQEIHQNGTFLLFFPPVLFCCLSAPAFHDKLA